MKKILRRVMLDLIKKSRYNLLKCVVFIILFTMLFCSLYIQNLSNQLEDSIVNEFDIYVEINPNLNEENMEIETYLEKTKEYKEIINEIGEHTNYSYYDFNISVVRYRSLLSTIEINEKDIVLFDNRGSSSTIDMETINNELNNGMLFTTGIKSARNIVPKDFEMNAAEIISGRFFEETEMLDKANVCLIPNGLKKYKDGKALSIWVGDEITISELVQDEQNNIVYYKEHNFKVIGVYDTKDQNGIKTMQGFREIPIYIPETTFKGMLESSLGVAQKNYEDYMENHNLFKVHPTIFKFTSIDDYKDFNQYLEKYSNIFNNGYTYNTTMETQHSTISNILAISKSISYIAILCLIACLSITFIILLFDIETTKKEIGILLSLGESLKGIVIQYILNLLIICFTSVSISFFITDVISASAVNVLIKEQLTQEETIQFNESDYKIEVEHYEEILKPSSFVENLNVSYKYIIGICVYGSFILITLIKRIDPKEMLKDD